MVPSDSSGWWPGAIVTLERKELPSQQHRPLDMVEHGCSSKLLNCVKENAGQSPCAAQMFAQRPSGLPPLLFPSQDGFSRAMGWRVSWALIFSSWYHNMQDLKGLLIVLLDLAPIQHKTLFLVSSPWWVSFWPGLGYTLSHTFRDPSVLCIF